MGGGRIFWLRVFFLRLKGVFTFFGQKGEAWDAIFWRGFVTGDPLGAYSFNKKPQGKKLKNFCVFLNFFGFVGIVGFRKDFLEA